MNTIPKLKKKIASFLTKEDGKISKESLIKTGVLLSIIALGGLRSVKADCVPRTHITYDENGDELVAEYTTPKMNAGYGDHCNELSMDYDEQAEEIVGKHNHAIHSSHSSHASHGNCGCRM